MSKKFNIFIFAGALALLGVFLFVLPPDPDAPAYENRVMADLPQFTVNEFFDGTYFNDLEEYLSDSAAHRTAFLNFTHALESAYGIDLGGPTLVMLNEDDLGMGLIPLLEDDDNWDAHALINLPDSTDEGAAFSPGGITVLEAGVAAAAGQSNGVMSGNGQTPPIPEAPLELTLDLTPRQQSLRVNTNEPFGADINYNPNAVLYSAFTFDAPVAARYAQILNSYRQSLPETVRVFSLLAPTSVEFLDARYRVGSSPQDESIQIVYDMLDSGIITVDAYSRIAKHADEYLFFRTDHHWTTLGAYYAYLAFAEAAGIFPVTIDNYVEHALPGFVGSFGRDGQSKAASDYPDTIYYYALDANVAFSPSLFSVPQSGRTVRYSVFLGGDHAFMEYTSSNKNGKTLIVIKESYANAFIPWVAPNYERIITLDPRSYEGSVTDLIDGLEETDILFLNYIRATSMKNFIERIARIK